MNYPKICVLLTQYKRNNLEKQLEQIAIQTARIDYLVVFQNENHYNIDYLKEKYKFIHVKSDYNTKFFGRFAYCFTIPADIFMIFDDDIIPGKCCVETYVDECIRLNGIIGGNGRISPYNKHKSTLKTPEDIGIRNEPLEVDFVGHLWCFKKDWLHYMFAIKPYTYDTGEDMHFCFSCKLLQNISCYVGKQSNSDESCDITMNGLSDDEHSSYKHTKSGLRNEICEYWKEKGLKFITNN